MSTKEVTVVVEEKAYEVGQCLVSIVSKAKAALADGFQPGQDIPVILAGSVADLLKIIGDMGSLPAESKENAGAFRKALVLSADDIAGVLLEGPKAPEQPTA